MKCDVCVVLYNRIKPIKPFQLNKTHLWSYYMKAVSYFRLCWIWPLWDDLHFTAFYCTETLTKGEKITFVIFKC